MDRACVNQPWAASCNVEKPNKADQVNSDPNDWKSLNGLWAPIPISAGWGHRPHWIKYVDPSTGVEYRMIAVPTSTFFGNEDARGGFGALNYESCLSQLESYNTDAAHPILVVLHHDGDNYGGGTDSYYGSNFDSFVSWLNSNPSRFVCTTIQDYLDQFPPATNDVIHDYFDKCYFSYEMKLTKPGAAIFNKMIVDAGIEPEASLFIDDGLKNIEQAAAMGMQTYWLHIPDDLSSLQKLL